MNADGSKCPPTGAMRNGGVSQKATADCADDADSYPLTATAARLSPFAIHTSLTLRAHHSSLASKLAGNGVPPDSYTSARVVPACLRHLATAHA
jgi:hypothetical protein